MQVDPSRCIRTCEEWPNGFANRLASSRKLQKAVDFTHLKMTCDQLVSRGVGWPNGKELASNCVGISAPPKSVQAHATR